MEDENIEINANVRMSIKLAYATGHILNDICASMWFTYLLVFFQYVLEFNGTQSGLILLIGQVVDALSTTFVGYYSDRSDDRQICSYGKRKTWHLFGTICTLGAFPFIFHSCVGCATSQKVPQLVYYAAFVGIFQFGWAAVQISHLSLIPELTSNDHERTQLTAFRYGSTVFSNLLVYSVAWLSLGDSSGLLSPDDEPKFWRIVGICLAFGAFMTFVFHTVVKEQPSHEDSSRSRSRSIRSVLSDRNLYAVGLNYMSTRLFYNLSQVILPLYLHETLHLSARWLATLPLFMYISGLVSSFGVQPLNKAAGRKGAFFFGTLAGIAACIWIKLRTGSVFDMNEIYGIVIFIGIAGSVMLVTSLGLTADLIGRDTDNGAFIYGFMSFTDKLSNGTAVMIIQHLHSVTCKESYYYRDVFAYVCGSSALIAFLAALSIRSRQRMDSQEIDVVAAPLINDEIRCIES